MMRKPLTPRHEAAIATAVWSAFPTRMTWTVSRPWKASRRP
jgi:hypothetical protein